MQILFVCTGNTCRSPMAEALMTKIGKENGFLRLSADSAGLFAKSGAAMSRNAKDALAKLFEIKNFDHSAKELTRDMLEKADLIVCATEDHRRFLIQKFGFEEKTISFPEDIFDPYGGFSEHYEKAALAIESGLKTLVAEGVVYD